MVARGLSACCSFLAGMACSAEARAPRASGNASAPGGSAPLLPATVHIGPMKTGSTALQFALRNGSRLRQLAEAEDGLDAARLPVGLFGGHYPLGGVLLHGHSEQTLAGPRAPAAWREFVRAVELATSLGRALLLSSESFCDAHAQPRPLLAALAPAFDVRVVVVYRRVFDWLVSMHQQLYRTDGWTTTVPRNVVARAARHHRTLGSWLHARGAGGARADFKRAWAGTGYDVWSRAGARVTVLNVHQGAEAPLLQQFVCGPMRAPVACAWLRASAEGRALARRRENPGESAERRYVADIGFAAVRAGEVPSAALERNVTDTRRFVDRLLDARRAGVAAGAGLPLACASEAELEWVWQLSVREEARLVPEWHDAARLRSAYEAALNSTAFCWADTALALQEGGAWLAVLRALGAPPEQ